MTRQDVLIIELSCRVLSGKELRRLLAGDPRSLGRSRRQPDRALSPRYKNRGFGEITRNSSGSGSAGDEGDTGEISRETVDKN